MTRQEILQKTRTVIYDCFPDMKDMELREDTVINTETAIDSMGFVLIICKLEALGHTELAVTLWDGRPVLIYSGEMQEQELKEKLRPLMARLPRGQQLAAILITADSLPRTATGKIKRWEVQQKAGML